MEESKTTSGYLYEDEFSYVTENGEIFRKKNAYQTERKLGEAPQEQLEEALAAYRSAFVQLEAKINDLADKEGLSAAQIEAAKETLNQAEAIGDFNRLYKQLDNLQGEVSKETQEPEKEEAGPLQYYKDLTHQAQDLAKQENWEEVAKKLDALSHQWSDGPEVTGSDEEEKIKDLFYKFTKAAESFENHKQAYYERANQKRIENLAQKREILGKIEKITNAKEWSATGRVRSLEKKWQHIGQVPKEQAPALEEKYKALIKEFKSHKVDRLVEKRQKQEDNLMMKMIVLDKMEALASPIDKSVTDWKKIDTTFAKLTKQWKKIGRVPREKADETWNRYKTVQDLYYDKKYNFDPQHRSKVDSFTAKKTNICEDAEALLEQKDLAKAAHQVNKLHRRWKKVGNLPQRKEDKLWDRFKAATDAFNEKKANNIDLIHKQEEEHYRQKMNLIEQAEALNDTTDWSEGHKKMQAFMREWKKIGPVPRKKSNKIWKQFKSAMDVFYDRRRDHFKEVKEQRKNNLQEKQDILEKLQALAEHEDPIEAVEEAKKLQARFKDAGYVPIKQKNTIWKKYREACDVIYDRFRAAKSGDKFDRELAKTSLNKKQRSKIQDLRKEHKKVKNQVRELKKEVLQFQESKTYFTSSDEDNPLLIELQQKIDKAQARLDSKQNKLDALTMEMEDIKEEA